MNIDLRVAIATVLLFTGTACKGAEDARAKTPPAAAATPASASAQSNAPTPAAATTAPTTDPLVAHATITHALVRGGWRISPPD